MKNNNHTYSVTLRKRKLEADEMNESLNEAVPIKLFLRGDGQRNE